MRDLRKYIFLFVLTVTFSGCALRFLSRIATADLAVMRGAGVRAGVAELALVDEAAAFSRLRIVRMAPRVSKPPLLYTIENGKPRYFAELLSENSIRSTVSGRVYADLPFRLFKVKGSVGAELRNGPGLNYKVYKTVPKDHIVLVLDESSGWYKVRVGEVEGWIIASALLNSEYGIKISSDGIPSSQSNPVYKKIACEYCTSKGSYGCYICHDKGVEDCKYCKGVGKTVCKSCKGNGKTACKKCNTTGKLQCSICKGKNSSNCMACSGYGTIKCFNCNGENWYNCTQCLSDGYINCDFCKSTGKIVCDVCDGTRNIKCYFCFGTGYYIKRIK